ncbi:MAG: FAD-dependent oxidoreductase [Oscillospiraceae bacterium]|nr:FAD-dependent oxidoreductase [Oscillospiraceae bacterium]
MTEYDILVVGGGTAGMTAGIYGARAGKKVLVLEELICGGQIVNAAEVENYPGIPSVSGADFSAALFDQASNAGAEFDFQSVDAIRKEADHFLVDTPSGPIAARAVILATGAKNRPLGVDREDTFTGRGVSYCATCDGAFYRGKTVAVVGGGNTALDDALVLSELAAKVYLIHRRDEFRGEKSTLELAETKENVTVLRSSAVTALQGEKKLAGITVKDLKTGSEQEIPVDGLFIAVGQMPQNDRFSDLIELENGYIRAGEDCRTSCPGIFAAGDCRTKTVRQLATAAGDGAVAALAALEYLQKK